MRLLGGAVLVLVAGQSTHAATLTNTYDALDRLTKQLGSDGTFYSYAYDPAGNRQTAVSGPVDSIFRTWSAASLPHLIGYADSGGWAVSAGTSSSYLAYGPYASITAGDHVAAWKVMVDNNTADNAQIITIDVHDSTSNVVLATATITRQQWNQIYTYQYFYLPFTITVAQVNDSLEYRTYYIGSSYTRIGEVGVL